MARQWLANNPSALVFEPVVVAANGADVAFVRATAARPVLGVVAVAAVCGRTAARMNAGAVPDLSAAPQRPPKSAPTSTGVLLVRLLRTGEVGREMVGLASQVVNDPRPATELVGSGAQFPQIGQLDLKLDDAAAAR